MHPQAATLWRGPRWTLALLLASFTAGSVWDHLGPKATFLLAAGFCSIGISAMLLRALVKIGRTLPPKHH